MAEMLPSNVDDPRFTAEPDPVAARSWLEPVLDALGESGVRLPEWLAGFVEAAHRLWA
jgi:hypothetical protein